jgi:hypothetical protein
VVDRDEANPIRDRTGCVRCRRRSHHVQLRRHLDLGPSRRIDLHLPLHHLLSNHGGRRCPARSLPIGQQRRKPAAPRSPCRRRRRLTPRRCGRLLHLPRAHRRRVAVAATSDVDTWSRPDATSLAGNFLALAGTLGFLVALQSNSM